MFEYERRQTRSAELIREAEHYRRAREARSARRDAARDARATPGPASGTRSEPGSGEQDAEGRTQRHRARRFRFQRTA